MNSEAGEDVVMRGVAEDKGTERATARTDGGRF